MPIHLHELRASFSRSQGRVERLRQRLRYYQALTEKICQPIIYSTGHATLEKLSNRSLYCVWFFCFVFSPCRLCYLGTVFLSKGDVDDSKELSVLFV